MAAECVGRFATGCMIFRKHLYRGGP